MMHARLPFCQKKRVKNPPLPVRHVTKNTLVVHHAMLLLLLKQTLHVVHHAMLLLKQTLHVVHHAMLLLLKKTLHVVHHAMLLLVKKGDRCLSLPVRQKKKTVSFETIAFLRCGISYINKNAKTTKNAFAAKIIGVEVGPVGTKNAKWIIP